MGALFLKTRGVIVKLGYAINYAKRIRPGSAFPDEVYIQWINQIEGLVQTDVWMLFAEDVLSYHENAEKGGAGVSFPDDKTLRFESDPGFYAGGEVVLSGFTTYAANNAIAARTILKRSADGLSYEFAEGTFAAVGTEPEESATAAVSYTEYGKELLVPKPHDKLYLSYLLAMIDLANAETRNYANSITVFNEDYQEYSGYYGLNVNPADGRAEFKGYYISAYSIARKNGFTGTEQEWLKSLEGSRGADGAPGAPIVIRDMYGTLDELRTAVTTPNLGDMYAVGTESANVVYFWNGTAWVCIGAVKGADGAPGKDGVDGAPGIAGKDGTSATIRIGTVSTGAAGSSAQVTNGGTESAAVLNFVIPRGADGTNGAAGKDGEPATIRVGTVSTGAAGSSAQVTNGGTESAAVLNFVIPRGADGAPGKDGADGAPGADGAQGEKGDPGADFRILGYYDTLSALTAAVTAPTAGDAYGVGTVEPYEIYVFDGVSGTWKNNGTIQGPAGKDGANGTNGTDGADGTDGREVELQATSTYIQWRYAGDATWNNLVALSSLKGADGAPGAAGTPGAAGADGREVEIQATSTYIQWRYAGETTWNNLVAMSSLKGAAGAPGAAGADGVGISGVAFKETDASGNNVYTITLTNGATYDFTAPKGATGSKGDTGATGPNSVSTSTATNITGILKGNGSTVAAAVAGTDYAAASHTHSYIPTSAKGAANGVASLDADTKVTAAQASAAVVNVSADLTLASAHAGRFLSCANTSAITITIPTGISAGTEIEIYRGGAGTVTLSAASGVTVECKESTYGIADQYTSVVLKWRATNVVVIEGNVG